MASCHLGKIHQVAGVELFALGGPAEIHIHPLFNAVTIAGGADLGAGAAGQTFIPPALPDIGLKFHIKNLRQVGGVDRTDEGFVLLL